VEVERHAGALHCVLEEVLGEGWFKNIQGDGYHTGALGSRQDSSWRPVVSGEDGWENIICRLPSTTVAHGQWEGFVHQEAGDTGVQDKQSQ
jgi:hypothetical protein